MENAIKDEWYEIVSKHDEFSAEELYTLLSPDDRKEFFAVLNKMSHKEKLAGLKYLISYQSDKQSTDLTIKTVPQPIQIPDVSPWIVPNTAPYPLPQVWCECVGNSICYNAIPCNKRYQATYTE